MQKIISTSLIAIATMLSVAIAPMSLQAATFTVQDDVPQNAKTSVTVQVNKTTTRCPVGCTCNGQTTTCPNITPATTTSTSTTTKGGKSATVMVGWETFLNLIQALK